MKVKLIKYLLNFKLPAGTSRGTLTSKPAWFLVFNTGLRNGIGEVSRLPGLSYDDGPGFEPALKSVINQINSSGSVNGMLEKTTRLPSIRFAIESGIMDLYTDKHIHYKNGFTQGKEGILINGLIWMGNADYMSQQIDAKLKAGFRCLKLKIGALDTASELAVLSAIRKRFPASDLEIRVDANGAFSPVQAEKIIETLATFKIHSIEQPIAPKQAEEMRKLCAKTAVPIALDEELIGVFDTKEKESLLTFIKPQYIILKPGLLGGFSSCSGWIDVATSEGIGYWVTSALESNVGLNAIAQWTATLGNPLHQGLGTGSLYTNNIPSPLLVRDEKLWYDPTKEWDFTQVDL